MKITERQLRRIINALLEDKNTVPGDAPENKQVHVFDFDDTLGVTKNSNGIMLMRDGKPAHKDKDEALEWAKSVGLENDLLPGPNGEEIEKPEGVDGFAVYINSGALAKVRGKYPNRASTPGKPKEEGEGLWIDYTPSSSTAAADPIDSTIEKLKNATQSGAKTMVMTARAGESGTPAGIDFSGKNIKTSNEKDISNFLSQKGVKPSKGVVGLTGGPKGQKIKSLFFAGKKEEEKPDELHFYDDDPVNTQNVELLADDPEVDAEIYIYGPGHFDKGEASPETPSEKFPPKKTQESVERSVVLERWMKIAGID